MLILNHHLTNGQVIAGMAVNLHWIHETAEAYPDDEGFYPCQQVLLYRVSMNPYSLQADTDPGSHQEEEFLILKLVTCTEI